jgi:hypothetical protein
MTDSENTSDSVEDSGAAAVKNRNTSERKSVGFKISKLFSGKMSSSSKLEVKTEITDDNDNDDDDNISSQHFGAGQRPVRKELLESNLDQEAAQQKLKGERLTTQDKHRKLAKKDALSQKRQQQASPRPERQEDDSMSPTSSSNANSDPAFSVATKQPGHKRQADDDDGVVEGTTDTKNLYLYEPANAAQGYKKRHCLSIDATKENGDHSSSSLSLSAAAARAAAAADGSHDKKLWIEKWNVPQWILIAAPAAVAALAVGAGVFFVKSIVLRKRST